MLARDRVTLRNVVVTMIAGTSATLIAGTTYLGRERLRSEPASRSAVLSDRMGAGARTSAEDIVVGALLAMAQPDEPEPGSAEATTAPAVPAPGAMSTGAPAADAGAPIGSAIDAGSPGTSALAASADAGADRPPTEQTNPPGP